jgi:DJ-1 family protein
MPRALVPLAEGFEEIEFATIVDVLRRGGVEVVVAGLQGRDPVSGAHDLRMFPDLALEEVEDDFDVLVLPGGAQGTENLAASAALRTMIRSRVAGARMVAAICAAPFVLDQAGVLEPDGYTCYPGWEVRLRTPGRRHELVVEDGALVTSQGPGTAMEFALHLLRRLRGAAVAQEVSRGLLYAR